MRWGLPVLTLAFATYGSAVVIRHDVADAQYRSHAAGIPVGAIRYLSGDTTFTTSATLISDRFILSAGHTHRTPPHQFLIGGQVYTIQQWTFHPLYNPVSPDLLAGWDFSIGRLDRRVLNVAPIPISNTPVTPGTIFTAAGLGGTGNGLTGQTSFPTPANVESWPLRAFTNRADFVADFPNVIFADFDHPNGSTNTLSGFGSSAQTTSLEGQLGWFDSGGPVVLQQNGRWVVVGVNSAISDFNNNTVRSDYGDFSVFSRVSVVFNWLNQTAWEAGRVAGRFSVPGNSGLLTQRSVTIRLRAPGTEADLETFSVPLAIDGGFSFVTSRRGLHDLVIESAGALRWTLRNVNITTTAPGNLAADLIMGDLNQDGIVDGNDVNAVLVNFGVEEGGVAQGDLNADGIVDGNDINLTLVNFGAESN